MTDILVKKDKIVSGFSLVMVFVCLVIVFSMPNIIYASACCIDDEVHGECAFRDAAPDHRPESASYRTFQEGDFIGVAPSTDTRDPEIETSRSLTMISGRNHPSHSASGTESIFQAGRSGTANPGVLDVTSIGKTANTRNMTINSAPKVLLVSSRLDDAHDLVNAANSNVLVIQYNPETTVLNELNAMVTDALKGGKASSIAFAAHNCGRNKFHIADSEVISLRSTVSNSKQGEFWRKLASNLEKGGRIDLLACDLAEGDEGGLLIGALEHVTGVDFAASTDATGNAEHGGNWILETDRINAEEYFNAPEIKNYTELMAANWEQTQKLTVSPFSSEFGFSVAVSGDGNTALIGGPTAGSEEDGEVFVFRYSEGSWVYDETIEAPEGGGFGVAVALSHDGNTALIGADRGEKAYIYSYDESWSLETTFDPSGSNESFGSSVCLSADGSTAVVGAPLFDDPSQNAGVVYVYTGSGWSDETKLSPTLYGSSIGDSQFGYSVSISSDGTTLLVGAPYFGLSPHGVVLVFTGSGTSWTQRTDFEGDGSTEYFGSGVSLASDGTTAVIGAPRNNSSTGAAYIYTGSGSSWTQQAKLSATGGATGDDFGTRVSISPDATTVLIGAPGDNSDLGAAYIFTGSGSSWEQQAKLIGDNSVDEDFAQWSMAISPDGKTAFIGARSYNGWQGTTYVFEAAGGPTWDGSESSDWTDGDNWSTGTQPGADDDVVIPDASTTDHDPNVAGGYTVNSFTVENGGVVNFTSAAAKITADEGVISITGTGEGGNGALKAGSSSTQIQLEAQTGNLTLAGAKIVSNGGLIDIKSTAGAVVITGDTTLSVDNSNVNLTSSGGDIAGGGSLTITVNGVAGESVTIADDINGLAALTISNAPQVDLQNVSVTTGNIAVTGSNIDLNGATYTSAGGSVTFTGAVDLDSPGGAAVSSGGEAGDDISFTGTIDGKDDDTQSLTLDAGSAGTVSVSGAIGGTASKQIKTLTITNSNGATFSGAVTADTGVVLTDSEDGSDIVFDGALVTPTLTTADQGYNVQLNGDGTTIADLVEFLNTGTVSLGDAAGDTLTFNGGIETTGNGSNPSSVSLNGALVTSNDVVTLGATTISGTAAINSGGGAIAFSGTTGGGGTLTASGGTVTYGLAGAQSIYTGTYAGVSFAGSGTKTLAGAIDVNGNLSIAPGVTLDVANGGDFGINVAGNWSNNGVFDGRSGTVTFDGSLAQGISDNSTFHNLTINASALVTLAGDVTVDGTLILTDGGGLIDTDGHTLTANGTILDDSAGTDFDGDHMIISNGTGSLRRTAPNAGTYLFPVGTLNGTAYYSPATLIFTDGSYDGGAYAEISVNNSKQPNNTSTTNYLNRYWTVAQSGISGFSCNASFNYQPDDVAGTEADISGAAYSGGAWTALSPVDTVNHKFSGTVASFSDFTGVGSYGVTYNANSATSGTAPAAQAKIKGLDLTLQTNSGSLARTGYTFSGWNTSATGLGTHYDAGGTYSANAAVTLYAEWTADTYTVTLDDQGGAGGSGSVTATYDSAMPSATAPTRDGFTFVGYYTETGGSGTQYYTAAMASARNWDRTSDTTLYAHWTTIVAPTATDATNVSGTGFTANWLSVAGATGYRLDVSEQDDFSTFVTGYQDKDVGNVTSSAITDLNEVTEYYYRLRAEKDGSTSDHSNTISVTTSDGTGVSAGVQDAVPNGGDGNGDGIQDSLQTSGASLPSASSDQSYLTLEVRDGCDRLHNVATGTYASVGTPDPGYEHPFELMSFNLPCATATVRVYYHGADSLAHFVYRKFGPTPDDWNSSVWYSMPDVTFGTEEIDGKTVHYVEFVLEESKLGDDTKGFLCGLKSSRNWITVSYSRPKRQVHMRCRSEDAAISPALPMQPNFIAAVSAVVSPA